MQWNYALDLGAGKLRMVMRGLDGMYTEANREVYHRGEKVPFARGEKALAFESRNTGDLIIKRCAHMGMPTDVSAAALWLRRIISLHEKRIPGQKTVLVAVSPFMADSERTTFLKAMLSEQLDAAGIVDSDIASLIGAGVDISYPETSVIVDIGASCVICSCIAGGNRVKACYLPYGLERIECEIADNISLATNSRAGLEEIQGYIRAIPETTDDFVGIAALDTETGLPAIVKVPKSLADKALSKLWDDIAELIVQTVTWLPEGCASDVLNNGVILTGGGSLLFGAVKHLKMRTGLNVRVAEDNENCVTNGLKKILEDQDRYTLQITDWLEAGMRA